LPRIFVCYRREDTFHITGRLGDRLRAQYGANSVFVDVNSNEAGVEYQRTTLAALRASDIVLVVIGDRWLGGRGLLSRARRGIHSPQSLARIEIEAALQARIPIVPVLVDGTRMPGERQLPPSIAGLAGIHGRRLDAGEDFDHHFKRLTERIDAVVAEPSIARGAVAEGAARKEPVGDTAAPPFAVSPPPARWPWVFPAAPIRYDPDQSRRASLEDAAADVVALVFPPTVRKERLWIAGATAVLVLPLMAAGAVLFSMEGWKFFGLLNQSQDKLLSSLAATSALIVAFIVFRCRRWNALDRLELASYWLAASAPVVAAFFVFSYVAEWSVFQLRTGDSGLAAGGAVVLATGLFLLGRHWNHWRERELPIYWAGCCAISFFAIVFPVLEGYARQQMDGMLALAGLLELCVGALLVWWRRNSLTPGDYVIFWLGVMPIGAIISIAISKLIPGGPWPAMGDDQGLAWWAAIVALSFVYLGLWLGHRLLLWERALCGVIATVFFWLGIAGLPLVSPVNVMLDAVAGVIFLFPMLQKTGSEMAKLLFKRARGKKRPVTR
jgi:hypothetical protein